MNANYQRLCYDFQDYANSLDSGHLKSWKAFSMISEFQQFPEIMHDEQEFLKHLESCLRMEGFNKKSIDLIMIWLYDRLV